MADNNYGLIDNTKSMLYYSDPKEVKFGDIIDDSTKDNHYLNFGGTAENGFSGFFYVKKKATTGSGLANYEENTIGYVPSKKGINPHDIKIVNGDEVLWLGTYDGVSANTNFKKVGLVNSFSGSQEREVTEFRAWGYDYPLKSISSNITGNFTIGGAVNANNEFVKKLTNNFMTTTTHDASGDDVTVELADHVFYFFFVINQRTKNDNDYIWFHYIPCRISSNTLEASESGYVPFNFTVEPLGDLYPQKYMIKKSEL